MEGRECYGRVETGAVEGVGNKWSNCGVGRETGGRETSEGVTEANIVWPTMHQDLLEYASPHIIFEASMNAEINNR